MFKVEKTWIDKLCKQLSIVSSNNKIMYIIINVERPNSIKIYVRVVPEV